MMRWKILVFALLATACQQVQQTPFSATIAPVQGANVVRVATVVPTANPIASRTPTLPPSATFTPSHTPTITLSPTSTSTPTDTLTPTITLTSAPIASATATDPADSADSTVAPTWTPPPPDPSVEISDHYTMRRPIAQGLTNWVDRTYPYGGTAGGRFVVHHGVEFVNGRGTPINAVADGSVIFAGSDRNQQIGPRSDFYGNLVIIQHNFNSTEGQPVYSLYGHMQNVDVQVGQTVSRGDQIGSVGDSGVAVGPHLHFEVRVGDAMSYGATRNPELWIFPFRTFGTLAGRVTDANGNLLQDVTLQVRSTDISRFAFSYADASLNADATFGENFTLGDLPANYYEVTVSDNGRVRFRRIVYVYPNRTTWVDVQLN